MEFLTTMTTQVPPGTSDAAVQNMRDREAARSRQLAADGSLIRLWRPPLRPGEWRSVGLFAASGRDELEEVLRSMPLRAWRTDEVEPLGVHPNDPRAAHVGAPEFLTTFTVTVPSGTAHERVDELSEQEARRTRELGDQGSLERLWLLAPQPGSWRALGLWSVADPASLDGLLRTLPMDQWMATSTVPLTPHPSDPGRSG
jgi:muconolactone delta-isomerase